MVQSVLPEAPTTALLCPSAPGRPGESVLIGVVTGEPGSPRVMPTDAPIEVTKELLALADPVSPSEVFRFASHCRGGACVHFSGSACQLAVRSVAILSEVTNGAPACAIRPHCRWFRQEGITICKRCPQIVTEQYAPSPEMLRVVLGDPPSQPGTPVENVGRDGIEPSTSGLKVENLAQSDSTPRQLALPSA